MHLTAKTNANKEKDSFITKIIVHIFRAFWKVFFQGCSLG